MSAALHSAQILPFPQRATAVPDASQRLTRAMAALDEALAGQRAAVAAWQGALAALRGSVAGLDGSLHGYQDVLGTLRARTEALRTQSLRLEAWADAVVVSAGGAA